MLKHLRLKNRKNKVYYYILTGLESAARNAGEAVPTRAFDAAKDMAAGKNFAKLAKGAKTVGVFVGIASGVISLTQLATKHNQNSDYARFAGSMAITVISVAQPEVGIPLGLLDAFGYFDGFYNSFDDPFMMSGVNHFYIR